MAGPTHGDDRVIRVFVSSTFRDMQTERDELVLRVFPRLRRLCEERGVTWGEVDLRWGITEEQPERGEVLPICLKEFKRCRPCFIGLLGERYGCLQTLSIWSRFPTRRTSSMPFRRLSFRSLSFKCDS